MRKIVRFYGPLGHYVNGMADDEGDVCDDDDGTDSGCRGDVWRAEGPRGSEGFACDAHKDLLRERLIKWLDTIPGNP